MDHEMIEIKRAINRVVKALKTGDEDFIQEITQLYDIDPNKLISVINEEDIELTDNYKKIIIEIGEKRIKQ